MICAWLLDYRPLVPSVASEAAAAAATLPDRLGMAMARIEGGHPEWAALSTCHRCEVYSRGVSAEWLLGVFREHFPPAARAGLTDGR